MAKMHRPIMWMTMIVIIVLTLLSIYGAFIGAIAAKVFFNSIPLAVYWIVFLGLLIAGLFTFKRLLRCPGLLLIHAGCIAILIGGAIGSAAGHQFRAKWFGQQLIPHGTLAVANGQTNNQVNVGDDGYVIHGGELYLIDRETERVTPVTVDSNNIMTLPFDVQVDEFRIEYYPGSLFVQSTQDEQRWKLAAEPNSAYELGGIYGTLEIAKVFKNFKYTIQDGNSVGYDAPTPGSNPALEVYVTPPGGTPNRHYISQNGSRGKAGIPLVMNYGPGGMVSDYISDLKVLKDGQCVAQKSIEVNHPLYYGGYHFYQSSYGQDQLTGQMYTVLSVISNAGLHWIYAGYIALCLGIIWQLWFKRLRTPRTKEAL
jgi:hypothetical protein